MKCPDCGFENVPGADACESCGQSLIHTETSDSALANCVCANSVDVLSPRPMVSAAPDETVRTVLHRMAENDVGAVVVLEQGRLAGIFSERDVLLRVEDDDLDRPVRDFMTTSVQTVLPEDSIGYALHEMDVGGYRHLPVVDQHGKVCGIISVRDVLHFLREHVESV